MQEGHPKLGLYDPSYEHDNCGIGAVVNIKGEKSHYTVDSALKIVENLEHRAGKDALGQTGDGVGILLQIPHLFFKKVIKAFVLPQIRDYGVGMFFFPSDELSRNQAKKMFEFIIQKEGLELLGWREVPIQKEVLGKKALDCLPSIWQAFIKKPEECKQGLDFDRRLYYARRIFEQSNENTYVCSLSSRTIVYKGMFLVGQLRSFFLDLQDQDFISAIALVHSRFSTNTFPSWQRAHPNRFIVHNGEINTIKGNANNMLSREENMENELIDEEKAYPVIDEKGSDSAMLDNTLEFLVMAGIELPKAIMMCIPEPYEKDASMSKTKKDFYQYYATMMEPWDGPASILFSDGDYMGAILDRNGLRPSRYYITKDHYLILASEVGTLDIAPENILVKERLRPGKMLLVDTREGKLIDDDTLKESYAKAKPYGEWLESDLVDLNNLKIPNQKVPKLTGSKLAIMQKAQGYYYEDVYQSILPMALTGKEPTMAMGVDTPLAVLSKHHQPLFNYFKQLFAQVTNPPIDSLREEMVTSTTLYLGKDGNLLKEDPKNCHVLKVDNPILTNTDLMKIRSNQIEGFKSATLDMTYLKNSSLEKAINRLFRQADKAYNQGVNILILSDRNIDENHVPIPSLLAVSAMNQHLVDTKKRMSVALIIESGEPREVHHFALLLGYGASAINNYLVQDTIGDLIDRDLLEKDYYAAVHDYNDAILHGIVKIASKMGISTIQSYRGSQNFEAIGISKEVIQKYFRNTTSPIDGITLKDIEEEINLRHQRVFDPLGLPVNLSLESNGMSKLRSNQEEHLYNPLTIYLLQNATRNQNYELFKKYSKLIHEELTPKNLRGMLDFKSTRKPVAIDEVESVDSIVQRFKTGAMSYGSISKEAHEALAIAMNELKGKSNSGEGGEDAIRYKPNEKGQDPSSAIHQVASGRFGVTSEYLVHAKELQIKMAQGAKPGEGGQLPAGKVYPWIAKTRHSTPGVDLISPPPHHDIYSIEDLAELIYDLKNANKEARISVKLVSEAGVGTIAAGVAKAGAQVILISGFDGGTGAAPRNSVFHAGLPWELGLVEAHQTLMMNDLRNKVILETDGKLMSGRDVAIATLLGAEEFGFATAPLITLGCVMMRVCNLDTCPVGVATQNPTLRKRFKGKSEYVVTFMRFVAQELREYMAMLGFKTVEEMVGHNECLQVKEEYQSSSIDLSPLLSQPIQNKPNHFDPKELYQFHLEKTKDETVLLKQMKTAILNNQPYKITVTVNNQDRAFATQAGSFITKYGAKDLKEDTYWIDCKGSGGQSFGAFIPQGLTLSLKGDANDYFGKGLSGGKLVVYPDEKSPFKADENIIIGNVAFYGATSGEAYIAGVAGERFAVRNSGIDGVVEGVGNHGLEYMTGGCIVILGEVGRNLAAGMSGGIAYIYDPNNCLYEKLNKEFVYYEQVSQKYDLMDLKIRLEKHYHYTRSKKAKMILDDYDKYSKMFKKIVPYAYSKMLSTIKHFEEKGLTNEQAKIEAFYALKKG